MLTHPSSELNGTLHERTPLIIRAVNNKGAASVAFRLETVTRTV